MKKPFVKQLPRIRQSTCAFIAMMTLLAAGSANAQVGRVTVHVQGESGQAVSNALVGAGFGTLIAPGWGWGGGKPNEVKGFTDANGICVLTGRGNGGDVGISAEKEGYYPSSGYSIDFTNVTGFVSRKWQPWNPTIEVVMRKIVNPVPMYAVRYGDGAPKSIPALGQPVAFDLEKADWVAPYGKGTNTDFIFRLDCRLGGMTSEGYQIFDATFNLSFPAPDDGIQSVYAPPSQGSSLRLPRLAPEQGYETNLVWHAYHHENESHVERREDQNYFFRVRTETDDDGNIISTLYGKIYGEIEFERSGEIRFTYYLNPTPNDRNMEFDPKHNLFENLSDLEEVREP